ncbi:hypothetical protein N7450_000834 [Penicillium hetheringtonii]|uniref:Uncharacterized protein n=1 Tax=Penicillium hetheringtonii TaxID=911720 RepID=A0AAD6E3F3_9EURO|nr:hypothetical protein N7450_000834 [Penicillium hetheringtonii]
MAMASSMDALGAFSHLQTNLPTWITRISELADHAAARHAEYSEAYRRHASYKPRRRKNSSVCSIHTDDFVPLANREDPKAEEAVEDIPPETRDTTTPNQQAGRKRGTDEAPSHRLGGPTHIQIVKEIGIARNNIRRGKMASMPRTGLRAGLLNRSAAIAGGEPSALSSLACVRSTRTGAGLVGVTGSTTGIKKESPFDYTDKQLELAHGLCETAAYQVLRSGDCGTELDGVEEKFKMMLEMVDKEVERLKEEKQKQEEEQAKSTSEETEEEEATPAAPPNPAAARLARIAAISAKAKQPSTSETPGAIEVDDTSSISAESIDLSAFRSSRIRV